MTGLSVGFSKRQVTKTEHISEFISITDDLDSTTPSMDGVQRKHYKEYDLTAPFHCAKALKTTAGDPVLAPVYLRKYIPKCDTHETFVQGSLESVDCSIEFLSKRPMELTAHVPSRPGWMQIAWGQEQYKNCAQPWTWEQLTTDYMHGIERFKMVRIWNVPRARGTLWRIRSAYHNFYSLTLTPFDPFVREAWAS